MRFPSTLVKIILLLTVVSIPWLARPPDSQGTEAWPVRYNGPGNDWDQARALAVDAQGNVYVTGQSFGVSSNTDYATLKYSPTGEQLWEARYNGPGNMADDAVALAVDAQGNVYVTGYSTGNGSVFDYATVKYSPAGARLWVRRYNGPGNADDRAVALAVDAEGNVYVTGYSTGIGSGYDYATIKYSPAGARLWTRRYNGPGNDWDQAHALAVDAQGNVCVTGESTGVGSGSDYVTIEYSPSGAVLWARRYNGPGNDYDGATAIALDGQGNVYVTGKSYGAGSSADYATIKYSPDGERLWTRRYNGPESFGDFATALALDGQGNVCVTGESIGIGLNADYVTIKYGPSGAVLWARRYNGPANDYDRATALALDGQGNVYVTGESEGAGSAYDYATIKYSATGERLWARRYNGAANDFDRAAALALDGQGNVYVTGYSNGGDSSDDYLTLKYSP